MTWRRRFAELDLVAVLLMVAALELAVNRLAVPVLRPPGIQRPPHWHANLDTVGLFLGYLSASLAIGVAAYRGLALGLRRDVVLPLRVIIGVVGTLFLALSVWAIFVEPSRAISFNLESAHTTLILLLLFALAMMPGDRRAKVGAALLVLPFFFHYYESFALRTIADPRRARALVETLEHATFWHLAATIIGAAVLLAPRPLRRTLLEPAPLVVAAFVGLVAAVLMDQRHYEVGKELAFNGLGIKLGDAPPSATVFAACVVAAAAVTWTLVATLGANASARRRIGVGFALVVIGGYGFAWPLQLVTALVGVFAVVEGAGAVGREESESGGLRGPPIAEATWRAYIDALAVRLEARVTTEPSEDVERTLLVGRRGDLPFSILVLRPALGVRQLEIRIGDIEASANPPPWTLLGRQEGLAEVAHPPPPPTVAPFIRTGDATFDLRFRVQDASGLSPKLLDEGLRARAAALLDGWIAIWPGKLLWYRVCPGRGAPLDHPIPVSELAFRGGGDPALATERLVRVFDLLAELAARATA